MMWFSSDVVGFLPFSLPSVSLITHSHTSVYLPDEVVEDRPPKLKPCEEKRMNWVFISSGERYHQGQILLASWTQIPVSRILGGWGLLSKASGLWQFILAAGAVKHKQSLNKILQQIAIYRFLSLPCCSQANETNFCVLNLQFAALLCCCFWEIFGSLQDFHCVMMPFV